MPAIFSSFTYCIKLINTRTLFKSSIHGLLKIKFKGFLVIVFSLNSDRLFIGYLKNLLHCHLCLKYGPSTSNFISIFFISFEMRVNLLKIGLSCLSSTALFLDDFGRLSNLYRCHLHILVMGYRMSSFFSSNKKGHYL